MDYEKNKRSVCSFFGCDNEKGGPIVEDRKILFFNFPQSSTRSEKWARACRTKNLVNSTSVVCSDHFEPQHFGVQTSKSASKLIWRAIPSIPARKDNKERLDDDGGVLYPAIDDWGAFLCRLCTKPVPVHAHDLQLDKSCIHIFGSEGQEMQLKEKIDLYLPNHIDLEDSLPKFVCRICVKKVLDTWEILQSFRNADTKLRKEIELRGNLKSLEAEGRHGHYLDSAYKVRCEQCSQQFSDISSLLLHETEHCKADNLAKLQPSTSSSLTYGNFQCSDCRSCFLSRSSLSYHRTQEHHIPLTTREEVMNSLLDGIEEELKIPKLPDLPPFNLSILESDSDLEYQGSVFEDVKSASSSEKVSQNSKVDIKNDTSRSNNMQSILKLSNKPKIVREKVRPLAGPKKKVIIQFIDGKPTLKTVNIELSSESEEETNEYQCSECDASLKNVEEFKIHVRIHLEAAKKKKLCNHCDKYFTRSGFLAHQKRLNTKESSEYECDICKKLFKSRVYIANHIKQVHGNNTYKCSKCPKSFKSKEGFQGHLLAHSGIRSFLCDICGKSFHTQSSMKIHRRRHTQQNFFECPDCGKKIQEHNRFQDHMRKHTGETPFGCNQCDKKFHSKKLLKQHMQIHENIRPYKCPKCSLTFKRVGNLKQHLERHDTYRPICSICRASFNTCEERNEHRRAHTQEDRERAKELRLRPRGPKRDRNQFLCKGCDVIFPTKEEKAAHIAAFPEHSNSIKCNLCDQTFRSHQTLSVHQRMHSGERPFMCSECSKTFRTHTTYRQHMMIHNTEQKFKCKECDKSFSRMYALNVHQKTHLNEFRPHVCPICQHSFRQRQDLRKHLRTHDKAIDSQQVRASQIQQVTSKWGHLVVEEEMVLPQDSLETISIPLDSAHHLGAQSEISTLTIPAEMHQELQFAQLASNIVITVPIVNSSGAVESQAFFTV